MEMKAITFARWSYYFGYNKKCFQYKKYKLLQK